MDKLPEGRKDDSSKLRYDLIPVYPLKELALTYTIGARKYADNNWRQGLKFSRVIAALKRHLELWLEGEDRDPEGQHHLAAVAWNAFSLLWYSKFRPEFDDRADVINENKNQDNQATR